MYNAQPVRRYILNCGAVATCKSSAPAQTTEAPNPSSLSGNGVKRQSMYEVPKRHNVESERHNV
jgi:hypothetical protein